MKFCKSFANTIWKFSNMVYFLFRIAEFELSVATLGFETVHLKWRQIDSKHVISKYQILVDDKVMEIDANNMETCKSTPSFHKKTFFPNFCVTDPFKPEYYEEPLQNGIVNTNLEDCKMKCFRNYSCVQLIYFPAYAPDSEANVCYLRSSYNVNNGHPKKTGAQIFGIKSNRT